MSVLKIKDQNGNWQDIPAIKGADGAIQYRAGTNIQINNNTISTSGLNQTQVQDLIDASIEALGELGFTPTVVQTLPTQDIDTHTIYLVPKQDSEQEDAYDEWLYINNAWEHIGSTTIDLSNYYTKSEVDANKMPTYTFELDDDVFVSSGIAHNLTNAEKERLSEIFTNAYSRGYDTINILVKYNSGNSTNYRSSQFVCTPAPQQISRITSKPSSYRMTSPLQTILHISDTSTKSYTTFIQALNIHTMTWNNDVCTITGCQISANSLVLPTDQYFGDYLAKNNTRSYTPTQQYHPATKKYVDDSISNKIWIGTQSEYDAITTPNENTLYFIKEDTNAS